MIWPIFYGAPERSGSHLRDGSRSSQPAGGDGEREIRPQRSCAQYELGTGTKESEVGSTLDECYGDVTPTVAVISRFPVHCLAMNALTAFGLLAVTAMVVCYALEHRHSSFTLLFAFSCLLGSAYGFLQGAWPFGLVELVWSGIAVAKWSARRPTTHLGK